MDITAAQVSEVFGRGVALQQLGDLVGAVRAYAEAVRLDPRWAPAYCNLGTALGRLGNRQAAILAYRRALALRPDDAELFFSLGNVLAETGRLEEAAACHLRALRAGGPSAPRYHGLGVVLRAQGRIEAALAAFARACELEPNHARAQFDRALALLQLGRLEEGWRDFEWRWRLPGWRERHRSLPRWDGAGLDGRALLLQAEPVVADTILFARYLPLLKQRGAVVVVECPPALERLLSAAPGVDAVVSTGAAAPAVAVRCPLGSLPGLLGVGPAAAAPYLRPAERAAANLPTRPGARWKVGLVWRVGRRRQRHDERSCSLEHLLAMLEGLSEVEAYSLQTGDGTKDIERLACDAFVRDLGSHIGDLADAARLVMALDLIVAVDSPIAHLAGALGKPVWLLLPYAADWRWLTAREDSPWYPTIRLFRQARPGDWLGLVERVTRELANHFAPNPPARLGLLP